MSSKQVVEIQFEDLNPQKWCQPLKEDVFASLTSNEIMIRKPGSLFSPLLFGKFFDPSDAFPLWEFHSDELLPAASTHRTVDWYQTDTHFFIKADISGNSSSSVEVSVVNGKILEISGQEKESNVNVGGKRNYYWKSRQWWEHGFVRRIELGDQSDWTKSEAYVKNDALLEIIIPKIPHAPHHN